MEESSSERRRSSIVPGSNDAAAAAVPSSSGASATSKDVYPPTASDLFNRQVDQQKIESLNQRVFHLTAENDALRERHEKREQETHEFVAYFQKEIQTRDKQITRLTEELAALKLSHALEIESCQQAKETESQQLQQHFSSKEEKLTEQVFFLREELHQLESFKEMKDVIHNKMKELEVLLSKEREQTKENMGAMERKFLEEKARLQKEHEKKVEIVKQQAKEDARNGLDADTRKIVTDNRRMGEELRFQLQMTEELQKEKEIFEAKSKKYHMEMQIAKAKEEEYAAAAQKQAREIRQLRATIKDLEKRMGEGLAELEREKYVAENRNGRELEEMSLDVEGLRRLVRLKNKELRNLRRLAQTILDQRTEVEVFFLDALEFVKREIEESRRKQREQEMERYHTELHRANGMKGNPLRFPRLGTTANGSENAPETRHFTEKVDIRELSWENKERVLRLLFAKINGIQSAMDPGVEGANPTLMEPNAPVAKRRSVNQVDPQPTSTVYFATEPDTLSSASISSTAGATSGSITAGALSMSLSGLPIGPSPPSTRTTRKR
ncbi:hypothetical protein PINS_up016023 [Pythium insidiosum]|nr:hypothetical protein PINS_up016023 [Pythium insidiosum]